MNNNGVSVSLEGLSKKFGEFWALKDLTLRVTKGQIFGILGPNGAGKTTTIKLITGLLRPTEGRVLIDGIDIQAEPETVKKKFALVPDVPYLYEKLTGWEFMKFITKLYEIEREGIDQEIERHLVTFNIMNLAYELIDSYSHGQRQRLILASVILRDPEIIILDEPMVGLDPEAARMVKNMFKELAMRDKTIFLSTHTLSDAQELCHSLAIINKGSLIASGSMDELQDFAKKPRYNAGHRFPDNASLEDIYLSITKNA